MLTSLVFASSGAAAEFLAGADFSHLAFFEGRGIVYRDAGQARDAFAILTNRGLNCVRLRLFTSSATQALADPYNAINNLDYTVPLAVRVKQAGLKFLLDFHYSDTWADPGHQSKPAAWANLSFAQLAQQMRQYNSNSIAAFQAAGATPDYVQVGNEITSGMLWPDGQVGGAYDTPAQWSKLAQLLTNAISGVRDAAGTQMPQVMIHIDRGGDWAGTRWFFDRLQQQQVAFDIIAESYYPFWHGTLDDLRNCLTNAVQRYSKPVMVLETAFPWTNSTDILGIPATPAGQVQFVAALAQVVNGVPGNQGKGVFWWGSEYQRLAGYNLAGFDQRSFFSTGGNTLPVAGAVGQLIAPLMLSQRRSGGNLVLSWPLSGAGLSLARATNLGPASSWVRVTNAVQNTGTVFTTTVPLSPSQAAFYWLQ